ncbi:unnamed protein product [Effrenium voratum]|uniref:Uncharacterized protein n=1 Tax=Effrenium voratum TaxID=2562239 RepID=A0AA36IY69_9DINO|nr:unnamed protein product [Effrenium voratum]CAJ1445659.1 unnamed protein product [Effrenium voratum]
MRGALFVLLWLLPHSSSPACIQESLVYPCDGPCVLQSRTMSLAGINLDRLPEAGQVFALTRAANSRCLQPRAGYKGIRDTCAALLALRLPSVQRSPTCGTPRTRWTSASRLEVNARKAALQVLGGSGCREWHMCVPAEDSSVMNAQAVYMPQLALRRRCV